MNPIGARLREEREALGANQTDFAQIGGVQRRAQVNYEAGERSPDAAYLAAVAQAGVDVLYVLTGRRSVTYQTHAQGATVTSIGATESGGLTQLQVLEMVIDALHKLGKTLPAKAVFAVADAVMALQRAGATVNKSAVEAQLRLVR